MRRAVTIPPFSLEVYQEVRPRRRVIWERFFGFEWLLGVVVGCLFQGASHILQGAWCMEKHGCYRSLVDKCEAKGNQLNLEFMKQIATPPHKKTVRPGKWMVGSRDFAFWETLFSGAFALSFRGKASEVCGRRNLHFFFRPNFRPLLLWIFWGFCKVYPPPPEV